MSSRIEASAVSATVDDIHDGAVVVGAFERPGGYVLNPSAQQLDDRLGGLLLTYLDAIGFEGKLGNTRLLPAEGGTTAGLVMVVGLGKEEDLTPEVLRRASGAASKAGRKLESLAFALAEVLPDDPGLASRAIVEGALLGVYSFDEFKSSANGSTRLGSISVLGGDDPGVALGQLAADATMLARDLANTPAGDLPPRVLAERARAVAAAAGLECEVWEPERIAAERLGGLAAVAAGSVEPARLVTLTYAPRGESRGTLILVGKGITFDSGGLSLKTAEGMETMKTDMSGAAAVIAAMSTLGELRPDFGVVGIVPATENMPGGAATKPGDVFRARNGKTVEVLNTDAEGRLVLADALSLAAERRPDAIVDVATLTGACIVALGNRYAGLLANDDELADAVVGAAGRAGEAVWRLPLAHEYRKHLDSEVADMKNIGTRQGGAITAGLFLAEFAGDTPWAHLDIAGPARYDSDDAYVPKGSSGFATRTLIELIMSFRPGSAGA